MKKKSFEFEDRVDLDAEQTLHYRYLPRSVVKELRYWISQELSYLRIM